MRLDIGMRHQPARDKAVGGSSSPRRTASRRHATGVVERTVDTSQCSDAICDIEGPDVPVLFLHGLAASKEIFNQQILSPALRGHRVLAMDLPGHGASSKARDPGSCCSIAGYADLVIELLERLGIDQVVLVGWSLGGHIAFEIMSSFPGVVGAFIASAPPLSRDADALKRAYHPASLTALSEGRFMEEAAEATGEAEAARRLIVKQTQSAASTNPLVLSSLMEGRFEDERKLVESIDIPIAMVAGSDDTYINMAYMSDLPYAQLGGKTCYLIPGVGHMPFLGAPAIFNHLLGRFISDMKIRTQRLNEMPSLVYSG